MQTFNPEISAVTIYPDRALVQRTCPLELEAGQQTIVLRYLSRRLQSDSLKILIPNVEIIAIQSQAVYLEIPLDNQLDVAALATEKQKIQADLSAVDLAIEVQDEALRQLGLLRDSLNQALGGVIASGKSSIEAALALQTSHQSAYQTALQQKQSLSKQKISLQQALNEVDKLLSSIQAKTRPNDRRELIHYLARIQIQVKEALSTQLTATYLVDAVQWQAEYIMDLQSQQVRLRYGARIQQNTGEDWPELKLKLSTAQLAQKAKIPRIAVWEINRISPDSFEQEPRQAFRRNPETLDGTHSIVSRRLEPRPVPNRQEIAEEAQAETIGQVAVVDLETLESLAIPSSSSEVFVVLADLALPADYDYVAVPKVDSQAVHRAKIYNSSPYTFLSGKITIQENANVLSKTNLPRTSSGEEIEYPLFYEERIKLRRFLKEQVVFLQDEKTRLSRYRYQIQIENLLDAPIKLTLRDAIPVTLSADLKVELTEINPKPYEHSERGILKWVLELAPFEEQKLNFEFTISSPKEALLTGIV